MKNLRPFQVGLLVAFAVMGVAGVILLTTVGGLTGGGSGSYGGPVVIWGTFDQDAMERSLRQAVEIDESLAVVQYAEIDERTFNERLIDAIAEGRSPDAIILKHDNLVTLRSKLLAIPYETLPARTIRDNYVDGAEIFSLADGTYAIPLTVDPLVMYWNRDIFANAGYVFPPSTWEEVTEVSQVLTLRDATRNILQSTLAFGEYANVRNAKEVLLMLAMQSGSRLVEETDRGYFVGLNIPLNKEARDPLLASLDFYIGFSNPNSPLYSWNRSKDGDRQAFVANELALYFGFGSEINRIRDLNPNLNFDVAEVPQGAGATVRRAYGDFYGLAIPQASANPSGAYQALLRISAPDISSLINQSLGVSPASRGAVLSGSSDPYQQSIFDAALISRAWLDPESGLSDTILKDMVEDVTSNRVRTKQSVGQALGRLETTF